MKNKPFIILGSVNAILILSFIGLLISFKMEKEQEVLQVKQQKQLTENQMNRKNDGRYPNT